MSYASDNAGIRYVTAIDTTRWVPTSTQHELTPSALLIGKLFGDDPGPCNFRELRAVRLKNKVVVFAAIRDDYVVLEDEPHMFPSDELVSRLRMLM